MATNNTPASNKEVKYHIDGSIIEGVSPGGSCLILSKNPEFLRDIAPNFAPTVLLIATHVIYVYTGYIAFVIWLLYLLAPLNLPQDNHNLGFKSEKAFLNDKRFWIPQYAYVLAETISWIWGLILMSDVVDIDHPWFQRKPQTFLEYFMIAYTLAFFSGLNAMNGHELLHNKQWYNKFLGNFCFTKFCYSHFLDEHIKGHHKEIATHNDPSCARRGETLYYYIYRTVTQQQVKCWKRECTRIRKEMGKDVSTLTLILYNRMTMFHAIHLAIFCVIYMFLGWYSVIYQVVYTCGGTFFLENINYTQHYGLQREKDENGIYESINRMHSWNSYSSPGNFRLPRHSDHHNHSFRPYQILRRFEDAPTCTHDYLHMVVITMIPQLWFYIYDARIDALKDHKNGKANTKCPNYINPFIAEDKRLKYIDWVFLVSFQLLLTYGTFFV